MCVRVCVCVCVYVCVCAHVYACVCVLYTCSCAHAFLRALLELQQQNLLLLKVA